MFKIYDGRNEFYQWDLDRKLIVEDETIKQVHFCNRTDECSLVCDTYKEDGLTLVNVPNILLQQDWRINVYAYDVNYTKHHAVFNVNKRSKPDVYVYTETELATWGDLDARITALEEGGTGGGGNVDLTGYATEQYVNDNFASFEYVDNAIAEAIASIPFGDDIYFPEDGGNCRECGAPLDASGKCTEMNGPGCDGWGEGEEEPTDWQEGEWCKECNAGTYNANGLCKSCGYDVVHGGRKCSCGNELTSCECSNCGLSWHSAEGPNCVWCGIDMYE